MRILITGGAGFIGSRLLSLIEPEHEVRVVDNLHSQVHGESPAIPVFPQPWRFERGDVTDEDDLDRVLDGFAPEIIVHLAAETGTGQSLTNATSHASVNVVGTARVLDALTRHEIVPRRFVLTSSRAVYGEGSWIDKSGHVFAAAPRTTEMLERGVWQAMGSRGEQGVRGIGHDAEEVTARPSNVYGATKLAQEYIIGAWASSMGSTAAMLRLQNVYGAGQAVRNPYTGVLTSFASSLGRGDGIDVYEGGGIVRDFVHVGDVVAAVRAAFTCEIDGTTLTVDIGSGDHGTLIDYAQAMAKISGRQTTVTTSDNFRPGDVRSAFASNERAERYLGYRPQISFAEGAAELVDWVASEVGPR